VRGRDHVTRRRPCSIGISSGRKSISERASFSASNGGTRRVEALTMWPIATSYPQCPLLALLGHLSSCAAISGVIVSRRAALDLGPNVCSGFGRRRRLCADETRCSLQWVPARLRNRYFVPSMRRRPQAPSDLRQARDESRSVPDLRHLRLRIRRPCQSRRSWLLITSQLARLLRHYVPRPRRPYVCHRRTHLTWNLKVRRSRASTSYSISAGRIGVSQPSQVWPVPKPANIIPPTSGSVPAVTSRGFCPPRPAKTASRLRDVRPWVACR